MTTRLSIRNRFARTRRKVRKTPAWRQQSLEARGRTLLSVNFNPAVNFAAGGDVARGGGGLQRRRQARPGHRQLRQLERQRAAGHRVPAGSTLPSSTQLVTSGAGPWSVAVGDFNGDSRQDLVTADADSSNNSGSG